MSRRLAGATGVLLLVALILGAMVLGAGSASAAPGGRVERVLIVSVPTATWSDFEAADLPNFEAFFAEAAIGDLATRASRERRATRLGDGYVTLGAGTRAVGDATDGDGFGVEERFGRDTAAAVFARRTGTDVDAGLVQLGIAEILDRNEGQLYDAEPGALGEALTAAGRPTAVIANADGTEPAGVEPIYRRQAVSGLMDERGVVPAGRVDGGLLEPDPAAPFGVRYDNDAVVAALQDVWTPGATVLVEASDLARADAYSDFTTSSQGHLLRAEALARSDALFGELLREVDPDRDAVIVVAPAHPEDQVQLTVAALRAPGVDPGLLRSATTRRSGFVQLTDVAPTVLDLLGVDVPSSMSGRPFERGNEGGDLDQRIAHLVDADDAARFIADQVETVATVFVVLDAALVAGVVLWATGRPQKWGKRWASHEHGIGTGLQLGALGILGLVPATFLARLLPFHDGAAGLYWLFLIGAAAALVAIWRVIARGRDLDTLIAATATITGLLAVDAVTGSSLQISSALGNSPIVAGRFTGFGNLAYAALASAGLVLAVTLAARWSGRIGVSLGIATLVVVLAIDGAPFWGSDVGGIISMGPAYLLTAFVLLGWRIRLRSAALVAAATVVLLTVVGFVDLARPSESRTHLGRLFETIGDDGWSGLSTVLERKLDANLANITNTQWVFVIVIAVVLVVTLLLTKGEQLRALERRSPPLRAGALGALTLLVLGFALNDSGALVPGVMLTVFDAALVVLVVNPSRDRATEEREPAAVEQPA